MRSSDVNDYLKSMADEALTAKDFRTWSGSVLALGHTKAVCRQSYIHPGLLAAFEDGRLAVLLDKCSRDELVIPAEQTRNEGLLMAILPALTKV